MSRAFNAAESRLAGGGDGAARIDPRKSAIEALDLIDQVDRLIPAAWLEFGRDDEVCFIRIGLHDPRSLQHCTDIGLTPGDADQDAWRRFVGANGGIVADAALETTQSFRRR